MYILNCFRRYHYPEKLSEGFLKVTKNLIDQYLDQVDEAPLLSHMEFYRLINCVMHFNEQFPSELINSLVEKYLNNAPKIDEKVSIAVDDRWETYIGGASGIVGSLKYSRFRLDNLLFARLKDLLHTYHTEKQRYLEA